MVRLPRFAVFTLVSLVAFMVCVHAEPEDVSLVDRVAEADAAFTVRYVQENLLQALSRYEDVLPELADLGIQSQATVLNRLSQLCYEATVFSEGDTSEDGALFERGKAYGFQSLRLNPHFEASETSGFRDAVSHVTDPAALHWTASNWGKLCGMNPIEGLLQQGKVLALFSRSVEIDPGYFGGSSASSLGSLLIMSPAALGGDAEAGLALIEDAIALNPAYLSNRTILAEYWGFTYGYFGQLTGIRDAELIERELTAVLEAELGTWLFWNRQAKANAERLLRQLEEMRD